MKDFLQQAGCCAVVDGGLATELEANGADLNDLLWRAKCLFSSHDLIRKVIALFPDVQGYSGTICASHSDGDAEE
ncbi:Homocysteine S-methyltransferase 4 [Dendrobium catenatum]|uniref:Homocysteine S-methyltransferase 4 n=1 Tax=Dendrobium catenatum TaxID=906689 RepID=A0A2I0W4Q3_9ASPA|nr:Homocysteine S-methyltransferase 4 [Dendrobium catenatum]